MGFVTIPNRPDGNTIKSIEDILANFDAILGVINGNLDATNIAVGVLTQRLTSVQNAVAAGRTNTSLTATTAACSVSYILGVAKIALIAARASVDKTADISQAIYMGILLDGGPILDGYEQGGHLQNSGAAGLAPTVSALFQTGDPQHGISAPSVSGSGDFGNTTTAAMVAPLIAVYLPSGTHTVSLGFAIDSGGVYTVNSQALCVFV